MRSHKHNKYTLTYCPAGNFIRRSHNTTNTPLHIAQRVTLLGEVINTTNTTLDMAQRVTLYGEVINTKIHLYL